MSETAWYRRTDENTLSRIPDEEGQQAIADGDRDVFRAELKDGLLRLGLPWATDPVQFSPTAMQIR